MAEFPGFPGGGFDFGYNEAGAALAGLVVRDGSGNPRSGIIPSTINLITGRSDWNVDVAPFVVVRGDGPRVLLGGVDETLQVAIAPAPASNSRIDLVYALARNVDAGDPAGCVHVVTGVPGVSPVKPSLPAGGVELGTVTVPAAATGTSSSTIANTFPMTAAAGGIVPFRNEVELAGWTAAANGQSARTLDNGALHVRAGSAWSPVDVDWNTYTPTVTNLTVGNGVLVGQYKRHGKRVKVHIELAVGSTTAFNASLSARFGLPLGTIKQGAVSGTPFWLGPALIRDASAVQTWLGAVYGNGGDNYVIPYPTLVNGSYGTVTGITASSPMAFAAGDSVFFDFEYDQA